MKPAVVLILAFSNVLKLAYSGF